MSTDCPEQIVFDVEVRVMDGGTSFVTVLLHVLAHWFPPLLTVTEYVPAELTVMHCVVAPEDHA